MENWLAILVLFVTIIQLAVVMTSLNTIKEYLKVIAREILHQDTVKKELRDMLDMLDDGK